MAVSEDQTAPGSGKNVLLVDDSRVIRLAARRMLEALAFTCDEAENGQVALEKCAAAMPDAVLLDWNMPVLDGPGFLSGLRAMPGGDAPKVMFCTTMNDFASIQHALSKGADEYIMKPFDRGILESKLAQIGLI